MSMHRKDTDQPLAPIAYCVPEFPAQTHAFFWREIDALRMMGLGVRIFSTRRPREIAPHAFARAAADETHYLFPPKWLRVASFLARRPGRFLSAVGYALGLRGSSFADRLRAAALIPSAVDLATTCRANDIGHVHIHSFGNALHLGALANILSEMSYSATLHGDLPVYGGNHAEKLAGAAFATAVTMPLRDQITACSPGTPVSVITMGVDTDRFTPVRATPANAGKESVKVVSVARLNETKGHELFLEALANAIGTGIEIRYLVAGEGPHRAAIESRIAALELGDRVELLGSISEERVLGLLQEADIFVLSSFGLGEAAPVAVMEAMACGLPVICSLIGGTGDMIEDGRDGFLVAQRDVGGLSEALVRLASDESLRSRIGKAARKTACEKFDYRKTAARLHSQLAEHAD